MSRSVKRALNNFLILSTSVQKVLNNFLILRYVVIGKGPMYGNLKCKQLSLRVAPREESEVK